MTEEELCDKLFFPEEIKERVRAAGLATPFSAIEKQIAKLLSFDESENAGREIVSMIGDDPDGMKILSVHLAAARKTRELYILRGIGEDIFTHTFGCFMRFLKETTRNTGKTVFDRAWWTVRQLSLRLFRLGELEYEIDSDLRVHIHIPSDVNLSEEMLDKSLAQAADFFKVYFPSVKLERFYCKSWLLSPNLERILPPTSKIVCFARRFVLEEFYPDDKSYGWWVFGREELDGGELPENTSLQRNLKRFLKDGNMLGAAKGYLSASDAFRKS